MKRVLNGLLGAAINSAASAVTLIIVDPLQPEE